MNLYILRWNPNISSYKTEDHQDLVSHIKNNEQPTDFNWSIREYENLAKDDMFIVQVVNWYDNTAGATYRLEQIMMELP